MGKANRTLFYMEETEAQKVNKTKQIIGNAVRHLVSIISLQKPKQMKPSGYLAPLKFKVCHHGSLHLKLPALIIFVLLTHQWLGTVRASTSSWLSAQLCTDESILNLFPCWSKTFPPSFQLSILCQATRMACKSELCIRPHPPGWHPADWSTDSHTHSYNSSIHL